MIFINFFFARRAHLSLQRGHLFSLSTPLIGTQRTWFTVPIPVSAIRLYELCRSLCTHLVTQTPTYSNKVLFR